MSWAQQCMDYMVYPGEAATNYSKCALVGAWDYSTGTDVPAGTVPWGCACQASADGADNGVDSDAAWAACYAADQERPQMQEDGSEIQVNVIEFSTIVKSCAHDLKAKGSFPGGIWIGGLKHQMTQTTIEPVDNMNFVCVQASAPGEKGFMIVCTDEKCAGKACIIAAGFDKAGGYTAGMAKSVALDFAKWLVEQGTDKSW